MKKYIFILMISSIVSVQAMDSLNNKDSVKTELKRLLEEGNLDAFTNYVDEIVNSCLNEALGTVTNLDNALSLAVDYKFPAAVSNVLKRSYWMRDEIKQLYGLTLRQESASSDFDSLESKKIRAVRAELQSYLDRKKAE